MKKLPVFIAVIILLAVAAGCGSEARNDLKRAEAVMESRPDSALLILDSIDSGSLNRSSDRALYALLQTQARIKTYEPLTDDSLISGAVSYFTDHGPDSNLMKALFYQAEIRKNDLQYSKAIIPAMRSRELAIKIRNPYWHAKASELISDIYNATYCDEEALKFNMEAIVQYKKAYKINNARYSICDRAVDLRNMGAHEMSLKILDSLHNAVSKDGIDSSLGDYIRMQKFAIYYKINDFQKAVQILDDCDHAGKSPLDYTDMEQTMKYISKIRTGRFHNIPALIDSIETKAITCSDKGARYTLLAECYSEVHDLPKARLYYDSMMSWQNNRVNEILKQSVISSQRNYYKLEAKKERKHKDALIRLLLISGCITFLIIIIGIMHFRHKIQVKALELDEKIKDIVILSEKINDRTQKVNQLNSEIIRKENDIERLRDIVKNTETSRPSNLLEKNNELKVHIESLFKDQWQLLNRLCSQYVKEEFNDEIKKEALLKEINREIIDLKNPERLLEIRRCVNLYMNGILVDLENQCGFLKQDDISFIALLYAGFSPKTICLITGIKYKYFYNKRSRLIERIRKSNAESKAVFISKIPMNYSR